MPASTAPRRTQDSVGFASVPLLLNAYPDVLTQWSDWNPFPTTASRSTMSLHVVLTNGDLDHVLGLLSLRESQPLVVYSTPSVRAGHLERNVMLPTLQRFAGELTWNT